MSSQLFETDDPAPTRRRRNNNTQPVIPPVIPASVPPGHVRVTLDDIHLPDGDTAAVTYWEIDCDYDGRVFAGDRIMFPDQADDKLIKQLLPLFDDPEERRAFTSTISAPFPAPASGRICVQAVDTLGRKTRHELSTTEGQP